MSRQEHLKSLIEKKSRRLEKLKDRQAIQGSSTSPEVLIEIEDLEAEIKELQLELKQCEFSHSEESFRVERGTQATAQQRLAAYKAAQIHNFDLTQFEKACIDHLADRQGLVGFLIPYNYPPFLISVCKRVKQKRTLNQTFLRSIIVLDPIHTPVDQAVHAITGFIQLLQEQDVLFPIGIGEADQVRKFWNSLRQSFAGKKLSNRLITIIGTNTMLSDLPGDLIPLNPPQFSPGDIYSWVGEIARTLRWSNDKADSLYKKLITKCKHGNEISIPSVYDNLEIVIDRIKRNQAVDQF